MSLKTKLGILGLVGSLALGTEAYAQNPRAGSARAQPNRILSRCPEYSASGEGILLKDFVFNEPNSSENLGKVFSCLYAQRGNISYDTINARRGLENVLSNLKNGVSTPEKRASIEYIQGLLRTVSERNTYMLIARSPAVAGYAAQSVPILVNTGARERRVPPAERREPARERADTLRVVERPRERPQYRPRQPRRETGRERQQPSYRLSPQLGLETELGTNGELSVGAFGNLPLSNHVRLEAFGNYSVSTGDAYLASVDTSVTERERQLIGTNTYKFRTDETITSANEIGAAEAGLGLTIVPSKYFELPFRAGVKRLRGTETVDGRSTIRFERDGLPLGDEEVITNSLENKSFRDRLSLSAGARLRIGRHMAVGASYNWVGKQNNGKVNFRFNF
ncbi:MAG: hypothetical protein Q8P79_01020 [Nanoarchaeota archaeon]|nr:hypothetical protein [Nanoarchaeota archaeon]